MLLVSAALVAMVLVSNSSGRQLVTGFAAAAAGPSLPVGWRHLELRRGGRITHWKLVEDDGVVVLNGCAEAGASLVYSAVELEPAANPVVHWRWKIAATVADSDLRSRTADDAAARMFVAFRWQPSLPGPWQQLVGPWQRLRYRLASSRLGEMPPFASLVYVWADREPRGLIVPSPRYERVVQVVVRSGDDPAGEWLSEARNVVADFRSWFGFDPPPISHVAFLVDSDDTGGHARAWFGDLAFGPARQRGLAPADQPQLPRPENPAPDAPVPLLIPPC